MSDVYTVPTLTDDTITLSSVSGATYPGPYTINTSNVTGIANPWLTQSPFSAPKIQLNGDGADVELHWRPTARTLPAPARPPRWRAPVFIAAAVIAGSLALVAAVVVAPWIAA